MKENLYVGPKHSRMRNYRNMAYMGIAGPFLFGVGDWLIYLYPGLVFGKDIQPLWIEMPIYRFIGSAWCGFIGGIIMMFGAYSAYRAIRNELGDKVGRMSKLGIAGAVLASFAHFNFGTLQENLSPLIPSCQKSFFNCILVRKQDEEFPL